MRRTPLMLLAALSWGLAAAPAAAGMFCGGKGVEQLGHQVLLERVGDEIAATHAVEYQSEAPDVAWVLPVPARPKVALAEPGELTSLGHATQLSFTVEERVSGWSLLLGIWLPASLMLAFFLLWGMKGLIALGLLAVLGTIAMPSFIGKGSDRAEAFNVGRLGPYETATLRAETPRALLEWLRAHGHRVPARIEPLMAPYVAEGAYFVALRLHPEARGSSRGEHMAPVTIRWKGDRLTLPVRLGSVSAAREMNMTVWVRGPSRAVCTNWPHVELNPAALDWLRRGKNYRKTVAAAVREAGGRAFVADVALADPLVENAYVSRFATVVAPEAMTADPTFAFVGGLPDVFPRRSVSGAPDEWTFLLNDRPPVFVEGPEGLRWRHGYAFKEHPPLRELPAALRVVRYDAAGKATVERDNLEAVRTLLATRAVGFASDGVPRDEGPIWPWTRPIWLLVAGGGPPLLLAWLARRRLRLRAAASPDPAAGAP